MRLGALPDAFTTPDAGAPSVTLVDRHGEMLYETRSGTGMRAAPLVPGAIPPVVAAATLAAEDRRFASHWGVDPLSIVRAAVANVRALRVVQGGSTITQQVVSLVEARHGRPQARTIGQKIREAVIAFRLEHHWSKDQILARYLELAPYGNQVEGITRASTFYFNRPVSDLTPAQAAYLAALPQQPSRFNPRRNLARALPRQQRILAAMEDAGALSAVDARIARDERITIERPAQTLIAPHFVQRVLALSASSSASSVSSVSSVSSASSASHIVRTSLDAPLQRSILGIVRAHRAMLKVHDANNVAIAVIDNRTGQWLAWEGSGDYFDEDHGGAIDGVVSLRQPGSALKPFTYAAAFEAGWHPGRVLPDIPSQFATAEPGILYRPRNYDGRFRGPLRARLALAGSENVPAVALASAIGVPAVANVLRRSGLSTLDKTAAHYGLGLTLGNAEVRLDELVAAYAMIARGGVAVTPTFSGDQPVGEAVPARVLSSRAAFWIGDILSDRDAREYIFGEGSSLDFPFAVAAKTGTSQAYHDNWTIGFTRDVTVGVWVGNFDRTPLRQSSGVTGAGPIFRDVMLAAVERVRGSLPLFDPAPLSAPPDDLREVTLCALSGMVAGAACPVRTREFLPAADAPHECLWHHASDRGLVTVWPAEYREWARSLGVPTPDAPLTPLPGSAQVSQTSVAMAPRPRAAAGALAIHHPPAGATYLIDPTLRADFQTLPLRARGATGRVEWFVNDAPVGVSLGEAPLAWPLARGSHTIQARDANGRSASTRIIVK
ncbi:MAG: penicillin-binding protein 1C [Acidobacteria bacterium]|nr:penicillin-binding protein 1C [Acidobacteriota bacterium]